MMEIVMRCPHCGPDVFADENDCCAACGCDADEREHESILALRKKYGARDDETVFQFVARLAQENADLEEVNEVARGDLCRALAAESNYQHQLELCGAVLLRANVGDFHDQDQRPLDTAERIAILARRSTPHDDPRRTAYVVGLERAALRLLDIGDAWVDGPIDTVDRHKDEVESALEQLHEATRDRAKHTSIITRAFHDGAMATLRDEIAGLKTELAIYIDKAEKFAREADQLREMIRMSK
jgi:molybdopterin converting factor small subunit